MSLQNKYPVLGSSVDPKKLSATFKGIAVLVLPTLLLVLRLFGVELPEIEVMDIINQIATLITMVGGVIGGLITLFGLVRKIVNRFKKQ